MCTLGWATPSYRRVISAAACRQTAAQKAFCEIMPARGQSSASMGMFEVEGRGVRGYFAAVVRSRQTYRTPDALKSPGVRVLPK